MKVRAFTNIGSRPNNEDTVLIDDKVFVDSADFQCDSCSLGAVFDGVGGVPLGEVASKTAADLLAKSFNKEMSIHDFLKLGIELNEAVIELSKRNYRGPCTTMVGYVELQGEKYIFNVGDSKALLYSFGMISEVSTEDSVYPSKYGEGEHTHSPITSYLGKSHLRRCDIHLRQINVGEGDIILITSDGITGVIERREMEEILNSYDFDEAYRKILDKMLEKGPDDNYSFVMIGF
ncbi:MAG: protein phosphatase 2C domain-containing protein [Bacilli bacterium]|nr:protein phosphatase 2C domain-containing protein [Bacilli bacterium]